MNLHDHGQGHTTPAPITLDVIRADAQKHVQKLSASKCVTALTMREDTSATVSCLLDPILHSIGVAGLAGSSDTGKSSFLRQFAAAVCAGETHFMGFPLHTKHRSVIYVSTEDSRDATRVVVNRQTRHYSDEQVEGLRFLFDYEQLLPTLRHELLTAPADLIIIDCFADIYGDDLRDTQRVRSFLMPYQKLAEDAELLVLFLHHTGKRTEHLIPSKNNLLGAQGFEAKMRLVIELRADLVQPHTRHLCIVKGNYLPNSYKKESYVLHFDEDNFTFSLTAERTPFELLIKNTEEDPSKAKWEEAQELKEKGLKYDDIAEALGYAHRSAIAKLFEKAKKMGWAKEADVEDEKEE